MTKQEAIKKVKESASSVFLKDDVVSLIDTIIPTDIVVLPEPNNTDYEALEKHICDYFLHRLTDEDYFIFDDIRYTIDNYNTVYAEDIPINHKRINEAIKQAIQSFIQKK